MHIVFFLLLVGLTTSEREGRSNVVWCEYDSISARQKISEYQSVCTGSEKILFADDEFFLQSLNFALENRRKITVDGWNSAFISRYKRFNAESQLRSMGSFLLSFGLIQLLKEEKFGSNPYWLEFGIFRGKSINISYDLLKERRIQVIGFDSFTGLPQAWRASGGFKKGAFNLEGKLPPVREGVRLIPGFFNQSLPLFLTKSPNLELTGFSIDCDLYLGALEVLILLHPFLKKDALIHFHEIAPGKRSTDKTDEARALQTYLLACPGISLRLVPIASLFFQPALFTVNSLSESIQGQPCPYLPLTITKDLFGWSLQRHSLTLVQDSDPNGV
uniref:Uncharacterized protein n=1 Tax=Aureoumbra lagunensis TaxID=44058 RepID=A0A6S8AZL1_9STRA